MGQTARHDWVDRRASIEKQLGDFGEIIRACCVQRHSNELDNNLFNNLCSDLRSKLCGILRNKRCSKPFSSLRTEFAAQPAPNQGNRR